MKGLTRLELKKIIHSNSAILLVIFFLIILSSIVSISSVDIIDNNGEFYSGIGGWKILSEQAKVSDGYVTKEYMLKEKERYDRSNGKPYIEGTRKEDRKLGLKLVYPQDFLFMTLNAPYGQDILTTYIDMNLTEQEMEDFYVNWPKTVIEVLKRTETPYSDQEYKLIYSKAKAVEEPFYYAYNMGWQAFSNSLEQTWWGFAIFLSVLFASAFQKNSTVGMSEITLYNRESRKRLYGHKIFAQLLFGASVYLMYILSILLIVGVIYGLHGWNSSIQFIDSMNIFSLKVWQGILFKIAVGLLATFIYVYFISFLSLLLKNDKGTIVVFTLLEVLLTYKSNWLANTSEVVFNLLPQNFIRGILSTNKLFFIGDQIVPYGFVTIMVGCLYILILEFASKWLLRDYYI